MQLDFVKFFSSFGFTFEKKVIIQLNSVSANLINHKSFKNVKMDDMRMKLFQIGFNRKCAFFARLGVLFHLHMADSESPSIADYRQVYPILYKTLTGYGMPENPKEFSSDLVRLGPVHIQRRAMHEVFVSALRAEYYDAAIRHLCYILQVSNTNFRFN